MHSFAKEDEVQRSLIGSRIISRFVLIILLAGRQHRIRLYRPCTAMLCTMVEQSFRQGAFFSSICDSPKQIFIKVIEYFGLNFQESIDLSQLPALLGIRQYCLDLSFM